MKAAERKRKRLQEKSKNNIELDNYEIPKKKLTSISSQQNEGKLISQKNTNEINNDNKDQNITVSNPTNNKDMERLSQRIRERKEKRRIKNMIEAGINPTFENNDNTNNININTKSITNKNIINEKDSNKLIHSIESMAPPTMGQKKVNFHIPSNKTILNLDNNNNSTNYNFIFNKKNSIRSSNSINNNMNNNMNNNINDNLSITSAPNYQLLSQNFANIKNENIEDFLKKTNSSKPKNEQKESEVKKMIEIMNLRPNPKNANNKANVNDENNYAFQLTKKIEENSEYYENKKEIKELKEIVKEEEKKTEQMLQRNKEEIQKYIGKIILLQNNLINSKQGDIVALEEAIKIDDIQINNLSVTYQRLKEENEKEKTEMLSLINKEILPLQNELKNEIDEVRKLKNQLIRWDKKSPPRDILRKIEVVMKYMRHCS